MTVGTQIPLISYVYSGAGDYTFNFKVTDETDLLLYWISADNSTLQELVLNTDYTVTVEDPQVADGGTCHVTLAETDGTLTIERDMVIDQQTDWVNNDPFDMDILERAIDKLTMIAQQQEVEISQTFQVAPGQVADFTIVMGDAANRAGKVWAFNFDGTVVIPLDTAEEKAYRWSETGEDIVVEFRDGQNRYSAYHWAQKAMTVVSLPFTQMGDLLTGSGSGWGAATVIPAGTQDQFLVTSPADFPTNNIGWKTIPTQLPGLLAGDELKILQVKQDLTGYELTDNYPDVFYHGSEFLDDDGSGSEVNAEVVSHYNNVARQFPAPAPEYMCWLNDVIVRRHDQFAYDFLLRVTREVGAAGTGNNARFECTAYMYALGATLDPIGVTVTMAADVALNASDTLATTFTIPALIPQAHVAGEDIMVSISVKRIAALADEYTGPADLIVGIMEKQ